VVDGRPEAPQRLGLTFAEFVWDTEGLKVRFS
jgi:hypothetical protein